MTLDGTRHGDGVAAVMAVAPGMIAVVVERHLAVMPVMKTTTLIIVYDGVVAPVVGIRQDNGVGAVVAVAPGMITVVVERYLAMMSVMKTASFIIVQDGVIVMPVMGGDHHVSLGGRRDGRDCQTKRQGSQDQSFHVDIPVCRNVIPSSKE
ncbi:hypothetical protein [Mesorhizobium sp. LNHC229A00]|uniref:hypothetical protein n=1 Tax=Mesorhizobium sp. LNHC229A00 TaxID=1287240 RepID=UPI00040B9865|nr:hypothetical protein [Mesorhizobium sp. LNHC229A00]